MKTYTAYLVIREKGTANRIKLKAKKLTEEAVDELQEAFVAELLNDPNRYARQDLAEGLKEAHEALSNGNGSGGQSVPMSKHKGESN